MGSPRSITVDPSVAIPKPWSAGTDTSRPSFAPGSQLAGTPPVVPQIPARVLSTSFQARSFKSQRQMQISAEENAGSSSSDIQIGPKTTLIPQQNTSSALTASLSGPSTVNAPAVVADTTTSSMSKPSSGNLLVRSSTPASNSGTSTPRADESNFSNLACVPDEEKARVLGLHLVSADERGGSKGPTPGAGMSLSGTPVMGSPAGSAVAGDSNISYSSATRRDDPEMFPIPYDAPGGDVTHDLYKWQHDHRQRPTRSASFSHVPLDRSTTLDPTLAHIKEPGGFRRNFVITRAQERGTGEPPMLRNVIDFLFLYGHFAGEDLDEDEDLDDDDVLPQVTTENGIQEYSRPLSPSQLGEPLSRGLTTERSPLLTRSISKTRHKRTKSGPGQGNASLTQAVLMLLKGFVGTGILFMGKAFYNGGLLFSALVLLLIAAISLWSFLLLVQTYMKVPGSFGDIGGILYGNSMRVTILTSITVSQIGFVAAYTIFIAENLQAFTMAVTDCKTFIPIQILIFAQLLLFLPLAMIRNLAKLSGTALVADAFILIGLIYIGTLETSVLSKEGLADVVLFNRDNFPLLIGTAVFAFEGIGLVIPITESMKEPQKFPRALTGVMVVVAVLFAGFGVLGYSAYGSDIQTVVIVNLPQEDKFVQAVQFIYSIAILLSIPLQLFPAVRIMETGLFSRSGKHNPRVKWQKNIFRASTVLFCSLLSWAGSSELDKFVSLIGSFACIPLCFIYPPMLHLRGCARTRQAKALDYALIVFGVVVGVYTTVQTIRSLFSPGSGEPPKFGKCEIPKGF